MSHDFSSTDKFDLLSSPSSFPYWSTTDQRSLPQVPSDGSSPRWCSAQAPRSMEVSKRLPSQFLAFSLGPPYWQILDPKPLRDILPTGHSPGVKEDEDSLSCQSLPRSSSFLLPHCSVGDRSWIHPTSQSRLRTTSSTISSPSFEHFISTLPTWISQFIRTIYNDLSYTNIFDFLSSPSSSPIAVGDGSVESSQGTFGWVLATSTLVLHSSNTVSMCMAPAWTSIVPKRMVSVYHDIAPSPRDFLQTSFLFYGHLV
jgi:hypothetical protein